MAKDSKEARPITVDVEKRLRNLGYQGCIVATDQRSRARQREGQANNHQNVRIIPFEVAGKSWFEVLKYCYRDCAIIRD